MFHTPIRFFELYLSYGFSTKSVLVFTSVSVSFVHGFVGYPFLSLSRRIFGTSHDDVEIDRHDS